MSKKLTLNQETLSSLTSSSFDHTDHHPGATAPPCNGTIRPCPTTWDPPNDHTQTDS